MKVAPSGEMAVKRSASAAVLIGIGVCGAAVAGFFLMPGREKAQRPLRTVRPLDDTENVTLPREEPRTRIETTAPTRDSTPDTRPTDDSKAEPELADLAADLVEALGVSQDIALKIVRLLGERDLEAEKILDMYGENLTVEALKVTFPRLQSLDEAADRAVEALLTPEQQKEYRRLRSEGIIPGTAIEPPPAQDE